MSQTVAKVEEVKIIKKYRKLPPELRKRNRGIRRRKEACKITSLYLYKNEMNNIYTDQPETLQILDEDKLKNGKVSNRITQLYGPTSWPNYDWICEDCPDLPAFDNIIKLNEHLHKAHKKKFQRNCRECQKFTHHHGAYLNHVIEHHVPQNKFCCILCKKPTFLSNFKDLFLHYQSSHRKTSVSFCIYCGLHFIGGAKLKEHLIIKHKRNNDEGGDFECDKCGFTTDLRMKMKAHMIKHRKHLNFMCDQCTVSFVTSSYLSTHIKQVHSKVIFSCEKCGKGFKSGRRLRIHDRSVHQENKNFLCHICNKAFHAQYRLNSHLRIHTDAAEERHHCPHCERRFKYKPGMVYHIRY